MSPSSLRHSPRRIHMYRRTWWTAFMRDRMLSIYGCNGTLPRPLRIKREDCDVPMLCVSDFEIPERETEDESIEDVRSRHHALSS
jgi:hypothetical protein